MVVGIVKLCLFATVLWKKQSSCRGYIYNKRLSLNQISKWFAFNINCTIDITSEGQYTFALWLFTILGRVIVNFNQVCLDRKNPTFLWMLLYLTVEKQSFNQIFKSFFFPFSWINLCPIPMQLKSLISGLEYLFNYSRKQNNFCE